MKDLVDVLESYMIAEEGIISKFKNWADKENDKISMKKHGMKYNEYLASQRPKTQPVSSKKSTYYGPSFTINLSQLHKEVSFNTKAIPENSSTDYIAAEIVKDAKKVLQQIFKSNAFKEALIKFINECKSLVNDPPENFKGHIENYSEFAKLTVEKVITILKSDCKPKVHPDGDIIVIQESKPHWNTTFHMNELVGEIIEDKYTSCDFSYGDGDEGCIYI